MSSTPAMRVAGRTPKSVGQVLCRIGPKRRVYASRPEVMVIRTKATHSKTYSQKRRQWQRREQDIISYPSLSSSSQSGTTKWACHCQKGQDQMGMSLPEGPRAVSSGVAQQMYRSEFGI
eukprot:1184854-Prorocentrum_minimum.AAC.1